MPARQPPERVEHRGPPENVARDDGAWTKAAEGFARRHGLTADGLELRDGFVWASVDARAATLDALAQELVDALVDGLQIPKNMRWGAGDAALRAADPHARRAARDRRAPAEVAGVRSGRARARPPARRRPSSSSPTADAYVDALASARRHWCRPRAARKHDHRRGLDAAAAGARRRLERSGRRAGRGACTWSSARDVLAGAFDERYLELPDRVLVTAMQSHQRYLPLRRPAARASPGS